MISRRALFASTAAIALAPPTTGRLRAGVASVNITPPLGSSLAGSMTDGRASEVHDELFVKALVLDNGDTRLALVLADLCLLPGEAVARMKGGISNIPPENIAVAATHTHSGPTTTLIFQSRPDDTYVDFLVRRMSDAIVMAAARLQPARVGFGFGHEASIAFNRRYYMREGKVPPNPFGVIDMVRTNPGAGNPDVIKAAGPTDPTVGLMSVQTTSGKPLAIVANYSLHYVGGVGRGNVSADYFGYWAAEMTKRLGVAQGPGDPPFVAMLFNGCQGDINNIDVRRKADPVAPYQQMASVANVLAAASERALKEIRYSENVALGASQEWLELGVRLPSPDDVRVARKLLAEAPPADQYKEMPLIYARETVALSERFPRTQRVPVQAFRIGGTGLAWFPGEPFVELGLNVRRASPFTQNFMIGLAHCASGYVPTMEAHEQGGYETWRAKTSYLEIHAAPKITAAMVRRMEALA